MVLKAGKYGINSGNTFKVSNTRLLRQYRTSSVIVRHTFRATGDTRSNYDSGLGEDELKCDNLEFSLNKKERWTLPGLLEMDILNGSLNDLDYNIKLIERHKLATARHCVSACATKERITNTKTYKHKARGYFEVQDTHFKIRKNPYSRDCRFEFLRRRNSIDESIDDQLPIQVRYDVYHPCPHDSAVARNWKFIRHGPALSVRKKKRHTISRRPTHFKSRVSKQTPYNDAALMWKEFNDETEESWDFSDAEDETKDIKVSKNPLSEFFVHPLHTSKQQKGTLRRCKKRVSKFCDSNTLKCKPHVLYVDDPKITPNELDRTDSELNIMIPSPSSQITLMEPVCVILPTEQITPLQLQQQFKDKHKECECIPRKFILDISQQISKMPKFMNYRKSTRSLNGCLVFTVDKKHIMTTVDDSRVECKKALSPSDCVCKVLLNTNFSSHMKSLRLETVFDFMEIGIEELIVRCLSYLETLPDSLITLNDISPHVLNKNVVRTNLEIMSNWSTNAYYLDDDFVFKYFIHDMQTKLKHFNNNTAPILGTSSRVPFKHASIRLENKTGGCCQPMIFENKEATELGYEIVSHFEAAKSSPQEATLQQPDSRYCGVCYEDLTAQTPSTALIACGHWFCDKCWRYHLETKVHSGATKLPCPEYDCDKEVDSGTALTFLPIPVIIKYAKRCHDTEVEQLAGARWCPNERCGRVLHVNSPNTKMGTCICGEQCCIDCLGKPHWPADCLSAQKFKQKLAQTGDAEVLHVEAMKRFVVNGKKCPTCKRFVEKIGGCNYMACVCGRAFCWCCGRDYHLVNHYECYSGGNGGYEYGNSHKTATKTVEAEDTLGTLKRRRWYKVALVHRAGQNPVLYDKMRAAANMLDAPFRREIIRSERRRAAIDLEFYMEGKDYVRESDKTTDFLNSLISLYKDTSMITEGIAVLLDSERPDVRCVRPQLQKLALRFANHVHYIYDLLMGSYGGNLVYTIDRMKRTRRHALKDIRIIVALVTTNKLLP